MGFRMKRFLAGLAMAILALEAVSAPQVYLDRAEFLSALASHGIATRSESFENDSTWAASRNSIIAPGSTPGVTSKGMRWTSNHPGNNIATGDVGGSAPSGTFAIYSLPHGMTSDSGLYCDSAEDPDIPVECFQNDGLLAATIDDALIYAFGARIETANSGKVTFLLDGVDINGNGSDNTGNWQREGDFADNWSFVGVVETSGFRSVELRELRGKDYQQVNLFADAFVIGVTVNDSDGDGVPDDADFYPHISLAGRPDTDGDGIPDDCDADCVLAGMTADTDDDGDGYIDEVDNCPMTANPDQADTDADGIGDVCELPPGCA